MLEMAKALWSDEAGMTTVEYALLLALLVVSAVGVWKGLGTKMKAWSLRPTPPSPQPEPSSRPVTTKVRGLRGWSTAQVATARACPAMCGGSSPPAPLCAALGGRFRHFASASARAVPAPWLRFHRRLGAGHPRPSPKLVPRPPVPPVASPSPRPLGCPLRSLVPYSNAGATARARRPAGPRAVRRAGGGRPSGTAPPRRRPSGACRTRTRRRIRRTRRGPRWGRWSGRPGGRGAGGRSCAGAQATGSR